MAPKALLLDLDDTILDDSDTLSVVTVKGVYAVKILEHFGIASVCGGVSGPTLGARNYTKAALIRDARAGILQSDARVVMIGDRAEDVRGARSNGVGSVAVTWGYGDHDELGAAQPDHIVASPRELVDYVRHAARALNE